jgi:hypothetical protein
MVFALTYETADLDKLPRRDDPLLKETLEEADAMVRTARFHPDVRPVKNP